MPKNPESDPNEHKDKINSFIRQAFREAEEAVRQHGRRIVEMPGTNGKPFYHCIRSEYFHKAMDRLTSQAGLRVL